MGCKPCEIMAVASHRRGLWSPDEDQRLRDYILKHGHGCWSQVAARAGLQRNGKSCRLRWINYLRPGLKRSVFTAEEEATVLKLHSTLGNKWSKIAEHLPGRTDNEVKNYFNTYLKKKVTKVEASAPHVLTTKLMSLNSDTDSEKQKQFSGESNSQISHSQSSDSLESFAPQCRTAETTFCKVIFADWLQMFSESDHHSSIYSMDASMHCQQESTSSSEILSDELLLLDMVSTDHFLHHFEDTNIFEGFQQQQKKQQQQMVLEPAEVVPEVSFNNLLSFNGTCNEFELNYDMFIDT